MDKATEQEVRRQAGGQCEYCRMPEQASRFRHVLDHIIARQHSGASTLDNLALCCGRCNLHKGPNISGIDPVTGVMTRLFHPRQDAWGEHFRWSGVLLVGITAVGRTTVAVLQMNHPNRLAAREALADAGEFPPSA
jgi:hypothetical protein